ncbi:MAG: CopG family transcriptional regulator [Tepidiformaceae bacterium]
MTVRVQILLSQDEDDAIEAEARRLGISKSEVVRRCVRPLVKVAEPWVSPYEDLIGIIKDGGPTDMGRNHDDYLYPAQPI